MPDVLAGRHVRAGSAGFQPDSEEWANRIERGQHRVPSIRDLLTSAAAELNQRNLAAPGQGRSRDAELGRHLSAGAPDSGANGRSAADERTSGTLFS